MSLNFCDLLVLGSDLSGVMAATLLAKRGMNVLILDDEDDQPRSPNLMTGLDSRAFKSLLGKLMIPDSKLQIFQENKVSGQIVLPRHRISVSPTRPLFFKEMEREFPEQKGGLEDLFAEIDHLREQYLEELIGFLPVIDRKEKNRFVKFLKALPGETLAACWQKLSPTLQTALRCQVKFFSRGPLMDPILLQLLLFLPPEGDKTFAIRGGVRELKKLFFDKLDYFGGMVHPLGSESPQFLSKRNTVSGVQIARYDFPTRCRYLLGNLDVQRLYASVPKTLWTFLRKREISRLHPFEEQRLMVYQLPREKLPEPMKENVILVTDPAAPLEGGNYLELNVQPASKSDEENVLLTVAYRRPPAHGSVDAEYFQKLEAKIESQIRWLIPFADEALQRVYPVASSEGELFPADPVQREARVSYPPSLVGPSPTSPFKNMFVLGPNILDWLGMEGKMMAALRGIDLIWSKESKIKGN